MRYPIKGKVATSTADEPNVDKWILDQKHSKNDRIKKNSLNGVLTTHTLNLCFCFERRNIILKAVHLISAPATAVYGFVRLNTDWQL